MFSSKIKTLIDSPGGKLALTVIVIGIWAINFLQFKNMEDDDESLSVNKIERNLEFDLEIPEFSKFDYKPQKRDPFTGVNKQPLPKPVIKNKPIPRVEKRPVLFLNGIIGNTAILSDENSNSFIVSKGDSIGTALVLAIQKELVVLSSYNKTFKITFNETKQ